MLIRRRRPVVVRVLENARVVLPDPFNRSATRERLTLASERAGMPAFEWRGRDLYARGVVGVIDLGDLVVELLPKAGISATADQGRAFLIDLLRFASGSKRIAVSQAAVATGERQLLEIVLEWIATTTAKHLLSGTPRRYMPREEISVAVRGRINLHHVARAKPGKALELSVRHAPLSADNTITRIVRWLIFQISRTTRSGNTRAVCERILSDMRAVADIVPTRADFDRINLQPLEGHWAPLLSFARSFVDRDRPEPTRSGSTPSIAVLFSLHDLFESALRRVFRENGLHAASSPSQHLLSPDVGQASPHPILRLKPDFKFILGGDPPRRGVGDAKWKRIIVDDRIVSLSEADAYQLTSYVTALRADAGFLFCPTYGTGSDGPLHVSPWKLSGSGRSIRVCAVHLPVLIDAGPDGKKLRSDLCQAIREASSAA